MKEVLQKDDPLLRKTASEVPVSDIPGQNIQKVVQEMKDALRPYKEGVAIAAPQIGYGLRIFAVSGHIFNEEALTENDKEKATSPDFVFINPEIVKSSQKKEWMNEGCLSVSNVFGEVRRALKVTVRAYDERGNLFTRGTSGLLAQIVQHEVDHLNGILFIDKAWDIREIPQEEVRS